MTAPPSSEVRLAPLRLTVLSSLDQGGLWCAPAGRQGRASPALRAPLPGLPVTAVRLRTYSLPWRAGGDAAVPLADPIRPGGSGPTSRLISRARGRAIEGRSHPTSRSAPATRLVVTGSHLAPPPLR